MHVQNLAVEVVKILVKAGFIAYFAGGWVRDYLLGLPSEDIDIATNAPPEKILDLFPHTILVGLSFGVVVVVHRGHHFEVATFRQDKDYVNGRKPTSIELSSPEKDASRRDFTINGMFYDPLEDVVYDYVSGKVDLHAGVIRTIGDPYARFNEDRLRMIRALRFSARFNFVVERETEQAIVANRDQLFPAVAIERVWQEFNKMAKSPNFDQALIHMHRLGLLGVIFPEIKTLHLTDLKHRVAFFSKYLKETPTIWYLLELFPEITVEGVKDLCLYLHTSLADSALGVFVIQLKEKMRAEILDKPALVVFYAHPLIHSALHMIGIKQEKPENFIKRHQEEMRILEKPIQRQIHKTPLVNAAKLQKHGVMPGRQMGILLKEVEKLAIVHDISDPELAIERLKQTQNWKDFLC